MMDSQGDRDDRWVGAGLRTEPGPQAGILKNG
jgi:hypothetical protein